MKPLLFIVFSFVVNSLYGQTTPFSFVNKPLIDPEVNSYGRGAQYWNGTPWDNSSAPQIPNGTNASGAKTYYTRYEWTDLESSQGVYTFTKASLGSNWWKSVENSLEWCANNGALYSLGGVMTAYDGQHGLFYDGAWSVYPPYLHALMQGESATKDWKYTGTNNWIPNWNSPSYLGRWRALNDTLHKYIKAWRYTPSSGVWAGRLIKGSDIIDYVDLRGFGNFGEWHTYPWGDDGSEPSYAKATDSTFKKLIDISVNIYGDYPLHIPVGAFDDNPWGEGTAFTTWYALTTQTRYGMIGWRRDNIGDVGLDGILIGNTFTYNGWKADTAILNRWKYAMITGEPLNGGGTCCPYYWHIRPEIATYHYAGFGNGNYGSNSSQTWDTIRTTIKLTGYRFNFNGGSMNTTLYQNSSFVVHLNIRNVGAAPLYQKRWRLKYELRNQNDSTLGTFISKFNPYLFLPSSTDSIIRDTFVIDANTPLSCTNKFVFYLEDAMGVLGRLPLTLNSPARNGDGSYTLRTNVCVDKQSALPLRDRDIRSVNTLNQIKVVPNPVTSNMLYVSLPRGAKKPTRYELLDMTGRLLHSKVEGNENFIIDTKDYKRGIYILKLFNRDFTLLHVEKIIIP